VNSNSWWRWPLALLQNILGSELIIATEIDCMKPKESRDFLSLADCVVSVDEEGTVKLSSMCETFQISAKDFEKLTAFVAKATWAITAKKLSL
jgi:hypothetical protein